MLQNLTNFFNLIRTRKIKTTLANNDLIAIGTRDNTWIGNYQPTAITFENLANQTRTAINFISTGIFSTNNVTNTFLTSVLIPANTYSSIDALSISAQFTKISGNTASTYFYINAVNSLSGATLLATSNLVTNNEFSALARNLYIDGLSTYLLDPSVNSQLDSNVTLGSAILNIDWTSDQYVIVAGKVNDPAISIQCRGIRIY